MQGKEARVVTSYYTGSARVYKTWDKSTVIRYRTSKTIVILLYICIFKKIM